MNEQNTLNAQVAKKDPKRCIVIALLIVSILSNIASAYYFSNQNFEKIMANEYSKFGGKANYELANQAQAIQLAQQIDQIKQFVEENKGKLPETKTNETDTKTDTNSPEATVKKLTSDEIAAIKKDAFIEGNPEATITLIEYTDPECPYCIRQARSGVVDKMREKYEGKVNSALKAFKAVPHKNADAESIALICAGKIGGVEAYSKYYNALFTKNSGSNDGEGIKLDQLTPIAKEAWVDEKKFQACYDAKETQGIYESYTAEGTKLWVQGTPGTVVINNKTGEYTLIAGAYPEEEFVKQIDAMLAK
jgi:protein-disulfide isomerase